jgi:hypothetical protein
VLGFFVSSYVIRGAEIKRRYSIAPFITFRSESDCWAAAPTLMIAANAHRTAQHSTGRFRAMARTPEQFKQAFLDVCQTRWDRGTYLEEFNRNHLTEAGARVFALEHSVFAANFPRWLGNIAGSCPHLDAPASDREYIRRSARPDRDHAHPEPGRFAVGLGLDRQLSTTIAARQTRWRMGYCEWASSGTG